MYQYQQLTINQKINFKSNILLANCSWLFSLPHTQSLALNTDLHHISRFDKLDL